MDSMDWTGRKFATRVLRCGIGGLISTLPFHARLAAPLIFVRSQTNPLSGTAYPCRRHPLLVLLLYGDGGSGGDCLIIFGRSGE